MQTREIIKRAEELEIMVNELLVVRLEREDLLETLVSAGRILMFRLRYEPGLAMPGGVEERLPEVMRVAVSTAIVDNRIHEKIRPEDLSTVRDGLFNLLRGLIDTVGLETASKVLEALIMKREIEKAHLKL